MTTDTHTMPATDVVAGDFLALPDGRVRRVAHVDRREHTVHITWELDTGMLAGWREYRNDEPVVLAGTAY